MRRLRAVAAIVALAVIWLGYSVAHEFAAELGSKAPQHADTLVSEAQAKELVRAHQRQHQRDRHGEEQERDEQGHGTSLAWEHTISPCGGGRGRFLTFPM